jgi:hypothetical protein
MEAEQLRLREPLVTTDDVLLNCLDGAIKEMHQLAAAVGQKLTRLTDVRIQFVNGNADNADIIAALQTTPTRCDE